MQLAAIGSLSTKTTCRHGDAAKEAMSGEPVMNTANGSSMSHHKSNANIGNSGTTEAAAGDGNTVTTMSSSANTNNSVTLMMMNHHRSHTPSIGTGHVTPANSNNSSRNNSLGNMRKIVTPEGE